jgi:hypothetical protein
MKKYVNYAALSVAFALLASSPASGGSIDFATLQLNGDASLVDGGSTLRLTPALTGRRGSAFIPVPFGYEAGFSSHFRFRIEGGGGDGVTFIVQNDLRGAEALGPAGISIGYGVPADFNFPGVEISPSVVVEFDTYRNSGNWGGFQIDDPDDNHIGVNVNGALKSEVTASPSISFKGASRFAWVDYNDETLEVFYSEDEVKPTTPFISYHIDIAAIVGSQAFFGLSAATGGDDPFHHIEAWSLDGLTPAPSPIPTPAVLPLLAPGLAVLGLIGWRKRKSV